MTQSVQLTINPSSVMPGTSIGNLFSDYDTSYFNDIVFPVVMEVKVNEDFTPTIEANFDFMGV